MGLKSFFKKIWPKTGFESFNPPFATEKYRRRKKLEDALFYTVFLPLTVSSLFFNGWDLGVEKAKKKGASLKKRYAKLKNESLFQPNPDYYENMEKRWKGRIELYKAVGDMGRENEGKRKELTDIYAEQNQLIERENLLLTNFVLGTITEPQYRQHSRREKIGAPLQDSELDIPRKYFPQLYGEMNVNRTKHSALNYWEQIAGFG